MSIYIPENTTIDISAIQKMPSRITILCFEEVKDMWGNPRRAVRAVWSDKHGVSTSHFCADTGDYLGEC